jgi:hypothetical protein
MAIPVALKSGVIMAVQLQASEEDVLPMASQPIIVHSFASARVALSARNATMSSVRHHSPVEACQRLQVGQPVSRSLQWSISTNGWSHCLQRLDGHGHSF